MKSFDIINVVGARPNMMKIAPIMEAMHSHAEFRPTLLHTGQHYDEKMSQIFFDELGIPRYLPRCWVRFPCRTDSTNHGRI